MKNIFVIDTLILREKLLPLLLPLRRFVSIGAVVCLLLSMALLESIPGPSYATTHLPLLHIAQHRHTKPSKIGLNTPVIQTITEKYMHALLAQDYAVMWSLLHPQMQMKWSGEAAFANFWLTRFQDYALENFTLGKVTPRPFWVDPETMVKYKQVYELPVSLELTLKNTRLLPQ